MRKNSCSHCGAWGQLSRFCTRCGKSIIYSSIESSEKDFEGKSVAKSTAFRDIPLIVFIGMVLTVVVFTALFLVLDLE
jgi:hypothetical protein